MSKRYWTFLIITSIFFSVGMRLFFDPGLSQFVYYVQCLPLMTITVSTVVSRNSYHRLHQLMMRIRGIENQIIQTDLGITFISTCVVITPALWTWFFFNPAQWIYLFMVQWIQLMFILLLINSIALRFSWFISAGGIIIGWMLIYLVVNLLMGLPWQYEPINFFLLLIISIILMLLWAKGLKVCGED